MFLINSGGRFPPPTSLNPTLTHAVLCVVYAAAGLQPLHAGLAVVGNDSLRAIQLLLSPFGTHRLLIGTSRDSGDV